MRTDNYPTTPTEYSDKTILMTEPQDATALSVFQQFLSAGYGRVIVAVSPRSRFREEVETIVAETRTPAGVVEILELDITNSESVTSGVTDLSGRKELRAAIDGVVLHGGLMGGSILEYGRFGKDTRLETTFIANVLGSHRLVSGLIDAGLLSGNAVVMLAEADVEDGESGDDFSVHQVAEDHFNGDLTMCVDAFAHGEEPFGKGSYDQAAWYRHSHTFAQLWLHALGRRLTPEQRVISMAHGSPVMEESHNSDHYDSGSNERPRRRRGPPPTVRRFIFRHIFPIVRRTIRVAMRARRQTQKYLPAPVARATAAGPCKRMTSCHRGRHGMSSKGDAYSHPAKPDLSSDIDLQDAVYAYVDKYAY